MVTTSKFAHSIPSILGICGFPIRLYIIYRKHPPAWNLIPLKPNAVEGSVG